MYWFTRATCREEASLHLDRFLTAGGLPDSAVGGGEMPPRMLLSVFRSNARVNEEDDILLSLGLDCRRSWFFLS